MAKYLIAGASGYVGARLARRLLAQGHAVRGLTRNSEHEVIQQLAAEGMTVWEGDVTRPESLIGIANNVEYVYNLTARSVLENGSVRRVFVEGNRNLIAACSRARTVRSYVFTGNLAPYGDRGDEWLTEDSDAAPAHPLGEIMFEAEQTILDMVRTHHFPAIILRLGMIYGPGRDPLAAVSSGAATLIGNGRNFAPYIHIDDLIATLERMPLEGQPGAIYNVTDDQPLRVSELYGEIHERLGMAPPQIFSKSVALASGIDPSIVGMASSSARVSNRRITQELDLRLRYPSVRDWLDERMAEAVEQETAV